MRLQHGSGSTLRFMPQWDDVPGDWTFPVDHDAWSAVAVTYKFDVSVDPIARVNFEDVTETQVDNPVGVRNPPGVGYCVGNVSGQTQTWDGRIAHVQIFNRILSAAEMDACLRGARFDQARSEALAADGQCQRRQ